jgi:hypothetical protein
VKDILSKMVEQCMGRYRQTQMKLDEWTEPGWRDAAKYFHERDNRYSTTELQVLAGFKSHMDDEAANPAPSIFGDLMVSLDIIPGILQMPHGTFPQGSSHLRLGCGRWQSKTCIALLPPDVEPDSSPIEKAKPIEPVNLYSCIFPCSQSPFTYQFRTKTW